MNVTAQAIGGTAARRPATLPWLHLRGLGEVRVDSNGQGARRALSRKGRGILYLLALRGDAGLHKEVLMDTFWRGYCAESARNCLNVTLHGLRRDLGHCGDFCAWVIYRDDCYAINPDLQLEFDVCHFEEALRQARRHDREGREREAITAFAEALGAYRGDFLCGEPYAEWAQAERARLAELRLGALERLAELHEARGDAAAARRQWGEIVTIDVCREDAHRGLMRCYAASGQRARALRQYAECRAALQREFELQPEQQTIDMAEKIRNGEAVDERLSAA